MRAVVGKLEKPVDKVSSYSNEQIKKFDQIKRLPFG